MTKPQEPVHEAGPFRLGYRPALDGLRAIAVLFVLAHHLHFKQVQGGYLGVTFFFVLSGFLITTLLCTEFGRSGRIALGAFYRRRALRLLPALFAVLVCLGALAAVLSPPARHRLLIEMAASATYTYDWFSAVQPSDWDYGYLGHTWSLAVEEQFYIVWPIALLLILRARWSRRSKLVAVASMAVAVACFRAALAVHGGYAFWAHQGFETRADSLLLGCLLGMALVWGVIPARSSAIARWGPYAGLAALVLLIGMGLRPPSGTRMLEWGYVVVSLITCLLIFDLVREGPSPVRSILGFAPLRWIGIISYGVYLWHFPIFKLMYEHWPYSNAWYGGMTALRVALVSATFAVAIASWFLIERPFLRLKNRPARMPRLGAEAPEPVVQPSEGAP